MLRAVKHSALLLASAIPVFLLVSACGSDNGATAKPAAGTPSTTAAQAVPATPAATDSQPAPPGAANSDKAIALLKKAATAAHMGPPRSDDTMTTCHFFMGRIYPATKQTPHNREKAASVLHAAGWTDELTGGSDESHLTGDGWDVFITRLTGGTDNNGSPAETLQIDANCIYPTATQS